MKEIPINPKTGLPKYCYRKGKNQLLYYIREGVIVRLCEPDNPKFCDVYREATKIAGDDNAILLRRTIRQSGMKKSELDQYFYRIEAGAKQRAKKQGRPYSLPKYWGANQYIEQRGFCAMTGLRMSKGEYRGDPNAASIDRIDSRRGYTPDNCHLVCLGVNISKRDMSVEDFIEFCRLVINHNRRTARERIENL